MRVLFCTPVDVEQIRAKQAAKPKHSPLPEAPSQPNEAGAHGADRALIDLVQWITLQATAAKNTGWREAEEKHTLAASVLTEQAAEVAATREALMLVAEAIGKDCATASLHLDVKDFIAKARAEKAEADCDEHKRKQDAAIKALEPFAAVPNEWHDDEPDSTLMDSFNGNEITLGHCRAAARAVHHLLNE